MSPAAGSYLAFVVFPGKVGVVLWQQTAGSIRILSQSNLIDVSSDHDAEISRGFDTALDELGSDALDVKEAVFIVSPKWVEQNDLAPTKKRFLTSLTHDLMLEPLGYVVLSDTILAHEAKQSTQEFNGGIIYDSPREWIIETIQNGQPQSLEIVGKSHDLPADIAEFSSRLKKVRNLPRIIFVPLSPATQGATEEILTKNTKNSAENISAEDLLRIAVEVGGGEILQQRVDTTAETVPGDENLAELSDTEVVLEESLTDPDDDFQALTAEDLNTDSGTPESVAAVHAPTVWDVEPQEGSRITEVSPAGFVIHRSAQDAIEEEYEENLPEELDEEIPFKAPKKSLLPAFSWPAFSLPGKPNLSGKNKLVWILAGSAALLFLTGGGLFWNARQTYSATATIWLKPELLQEEFSFSSGTATPSAQTTSAFPGNIITETVSLELEVPTTGTKLTGDPASGPVTIFNKTGQNKTFTAGTRLQTGGKTFELTEEVQVASASTQESTGSSTSIFGKASARARAIEIGPENNLEKDVNFTIANFDTSTYEAVSTEAFAGGSRREIQAASQKDVDQAVAQLRTSALQELTTLFGQKEKAGDTVFPNQNITLGNIVTTPKVGEEAKFVTVSLQAKTNALHLTAEQTLEEGNKLLATQLSENEELLPDTVKFSARDISVSSDGKTFSLQAVVSGQKVSRVLAENLKEIIAGQYEGRAETLLAEQPAIAKQEVSLHPTWAKWFFSSVPSDQNRIQVNIKLDR